MKTIPRKREVVAFLRDNNNNKKKHGIVKQG